MASDAGGTANVTTGGSNGGAPLSTNAGAANTAGATSAAGATNTAGATSAGMGGAAGAANDPGVPQQDYASKVNPWIETNKGRWFFSTPAAMPFGMVKLTPHSKNQDQGGGGYNYS
ncbi:MAG TPA: hypothetical protein VHW01_13730, partial [Polyangiaceae bacterium]|nr:hypothetical protein [Polyangiaceae bacterium]